jgi:putative phosphoribosyl transferase
MTETIGHGPVTRSVHVPVDSVDLTGILAVPAEPRAIVVFAHGSGSTHASPRNLAVARVLEHGGFATLRFDLLSPEEAADRANVFDVETLADRLLSARIWLGRRADTAGLPACYFGASTGAAAALIGAARRPAAVSAVVSRGGRPDLAGDWLPLVEAPTLLIVGEHDTAVIELNRRAAARLKCRHQLAIVPGAGHLFEEPGTLAEVARLAAAWLSGLVPRL